MDHTLPKTHYSWVNKYRICTELAQGIFFRCFKIVLQNSPAAEELHNHLYMLHTKLEVSRSCRITSRCNIWNLKFLAQVQVFVLNAADLQQSCCRDAADLLLPCWRVVTESPIDAKYQIWRLQVKSMFYSAADLLQASCGDAAEILQICCCPNAEEL